MNIDIKTEETFILSDAQVGIVRRVLDIIVEEHPREGLRLEDMADWPITGTVWEGLRLKRIVLGSRCRWDNQHEFSFRGGYCLGPRYGYVEAEGVCVTLEPESTGNCRANWSHRWFRVRGEALVEE